MKNIQDGNEKATRQCWECLKRRLVCDHTLPHCKKCQKAGKECPGYDEQKPLQWIETGMVTSRKRKNNSPPKIYSTATGKSTKAAAPKQSSKHAPTSNPSKAPPRTQDSDSIDKPFLLPSDDWEPKLIPDTSGEIEDPFARASDYPRALTYWLSPNDWDWEWSQVMEDPKAKAAQEYALKMACAIGEVEQIFSFGRETLEDVVARGDYHEAAVIVRSERQPLERLERLLNLMRLYEVPSYNYLSNETSDVVQAVNYYNTRIVPLFKISGELAPNPAVVMFPPSVLHVLPPAIHHTMVCLSLNHFVHSLPIGADKSVAVFNRSKVYHHRGAAIRALSHYVARDKTRCNDLSISSILMFMSMELQNPAMADWRSHASGLRRLIDMRGGFRSLMEQSPHLAPTLMVYILIVIMANSSSPAWDQIELSKTPEQTIEDVTAVYDTMFPYTLCPPQLFLDIIRVNQLRARASAVLFAAETDESLTLEAQDLLSHIEAFCPEDWAQPGNRYDEWLMIGNVYQSAVALYCTMSLQSLTVLPESLEMNAMRIIHSDRLSTAISSAMESVRLENYLLWPLTVLGVEAGYRNDLRRQTVGTHLSNLSRKHGTSSPLKAQAVLRRYWQKEEPGWDECFDRSYVFVI